MNKNSTALKDNIIATLEDQKARNIITFTLGEKSDIADFIIIATGNSSRHLLTLSEKIYRTAKTEKAKILGIDGETTGDWIVLDLEDIIIHLFREEVREYYKIEEIWE
ncbi:MAG: ribosome silencing factor [Alphaproteobacteria bacterium]|jgi:ribosome-associated protein|nr:ribosome silencing factor [Alphaproteobacteria bacterium]